MRKRPSARDIVIRKERDVRTFTIHGVTWRIGIWLSPESITLWDADTGAVYCEQPAEDIGITYRRGRYTPSGRMQERLLNAFAVAWVMLREEH